MRPLIFGEVLFDRFPDGSRVLGGAPFNVAWNLQALGARPLFISRVGDDPPGREICQQMAYWGMDQSALQLDTAHPTGAVAVTIEAGEPSFDIVDRCAYDYIDFHAIPAMADGAMLYHGSLALRHRTSAGTVDNLLAAYDLPRFIDVNLRPPWWDRGRVLEQLAKARWAKLNHEELQALSGDNQPLPVQAARLQESTGLALLIVTRGARGALARTLDGELLQIAPERPAPVTDTVGAGDAFASVIILGLLQGWELPLMLERAQTFASTVIGLRGATTSDKAFYAPFREQWDLT